MGPDSVSESTGSGTPPYAFSSPRSWMWMHTSLAVTWLLLAVFQFWWRPQPWFVGTLSLCVSAVNALAAVGRWRIPVAVVSVSGVKFGLRTVVPWSQVREVVVASDNRWTPQPPVIVFRDGRRQRSLPVLTPQSAEHASKPYRGR